MIILHVLNDLSTFTTHRKSLVDFLINHGHKIILVVPQHLDIKQLEACGYHNETYYLSRKGLNPFGELKTYLSLKRIYLKHQPDLVHHFTIKPVIYGSLASFRLQNTKVINSITGLGYVFTGRGLLPKLLRPFVKTLYRLAFSLSKAEIIFQNHDDQDLFVGLGIAKQTRCHFVPGSGVDIEKFKPSEQEPPLPLRVGLPARMLWDKGVGEFVEAAKLLKNEFPQVEFELIGGTDPQNRMSIPPQILTSWVSEGLIHWRGHQDNMLDTYHRLHIVCLPSYREGLPMALLEAAAIGKPIVTTDVPGCREVVKHGETGLLAEVKNPESLAKFIRELLIDKNLRTTLGAKARVAAQLLYAKPVVNKTILGIYSDGL